MPKPISKLFLTFCMLFTNQTLGKADELSAPKEDSKDFNGALFKTEYGFTFATNLPKTDEHNDALQNWHNSIGKSTAQVIDKGYKIRFDGKKTCELLLQIKKGRIVTCSIAKSSGNDTFDRMIVMSLDVVAQNENLEFPDPRISNLTEKLTFVRAYNSWTGTPVKKGQVLIQNCVLKDGKKLEEGH